MYQFDLVGRGALCHALPTTNVSPMSAAPKTAAMTIEARNGAPCVVKIEPAKIQRTTVGKIERSIRTKTANAKSSQSRRMLRAYRTY